MYIGTDAWIDAAGYLRQKDYIADKEGYRILKSKTVYVGVGRPIQVCSFNNIIIDLLIFLYHFQTGGHKSC